MNPPLILICIDKKIPSHNSLESGSSFGVNICNSEQGKLAWDFANSNVDKNELILSLNHEVTENKVPLLTDCLASMECTIKEAYGEITRYLSAKSNRVLTKTLSLSFIINLDLENSNQTSQIIFNNFLWNISSKSHLCTIKKC